MLTNARCVDGLDMDVNQQSRRERDKILLECQALLLKISKHRYSLKLLINAKTALEIIADYKRER